MSLKKTIWSFASSVVDGTRQGMVAVPFDTKRCKNKYRQYDHPQNPLANCQQSHRCGSKDEGLRCKKSLMARGRCTGGRETKGGRKTHKRCFVKYCPRAGRSSAGRSDMSQVVETLNFQKYFPLDDSALLILHHLMDELIEYSHSIRQLQIST